MNFVDEIYNMNSTVDRLNSSEAIPKKPKLTSLAFCNDMHNEINCNVFKQSKLSLFKHFLNILYI